MNKQRILIIAPSWVGDMMMAHSLFQQIISDNPGHYIGVVAPKWSVPLLDRMPEVKAIFTLEVGHNQLGLGARWKLAREIKQHKFDAAIILPRSIKSALIPWFARIGTRVGYLGESRYGMINRIAPMDKIKLPKTVDRFVYLFEHLMSQPRGKTVFLPKLDVNALTVVNVLEKYGIKAEKPIFVMCPGAEFGPSKQWPSANYRRIAEYYLSKKYQVIVLGSPNDKSVGLEITQGIDDAIEKDHLFNLINKTSLNEAVDIISASEKVLTNDSGLMHIASALNKPLVAIYGSTSPEMTPPLSIKATIIQKRFDCQPCFQRQCPLKEPELHHRCMKSIGVDDVLKAID